MAGLSLHGPTIAGQERVLTPAALEFVAMLAERFESRRRELIQRRHARWDRLKAGTERLDFLPATASIRGADWTVAPAPADLNDRRVETQNEIHHAPGESQVEAIADERGGEVKH